MALLKTEKSTMCNSDINELYCISFSDLFHNDSFVQINNCLLNGNKAAELELNHFIRYLIVPAFWRFFEKDESFRNTDLKNTHNLFEKFDAAVNFLHINFGLAKEFFERLKIIKPAGDSADLHTSQLRDIFRATLLSQLPADFRYIVHAFYFITLKAFTVCNRKVDFSDTNLKHLDETFCVSCDMHVANCVCQKFLDISNRVNQKLIDIDLLDCIAGQTLTSLIQEKIVKHIKETTEGIFYKSHLKELLLWLDAVVIRWLSHIFTYGNIENTKANSKAQSVLQSFEVKLSYYIYENFAYTVIEQFFNVIIDFPDSVPAIEDLKICMEKIDLRNYLIKNVKATLQARLLHPGVNTMDILTGYVAAIKTIRYLDNTGVILDAITAPIRDYLRKRSDTVRRVVTALTEEGPTDLSEELAKGEKLSKNKNLVIEEELANWETWQPDPFNIEFYSHTQNITANRSADIIAMVVEIYGSKELFVNEYRNLMADRLITSLDFSLEKEIRNLELLKLRFGETLLHSCEVMLKDVADSKRINLHIQNDAKYKENKMFDISSLIVSAQFWPSFNKENLELPPDIATEFKNYTTAFEAYKGNRTLNWRMVTGKVHIAIEIGKRSFEMTVAPTQAVIIYYYQKKKEWTLEGLSEVMKIPPTLLRRRMGFWIMQGLIRELQPGLFGLVEENSQKDETDKVHLSRLISDEEDIESAMASAKDQREEELQVFWSYIVGMLTNLDSLPLERIHQMLKLFASQGIGIEFSQEDLKTFLQRKAREHKLIYSGGVYQLNK